MKILSIGDLHGSNVWKSKDFSSYDLIIFLGDYIDTRQKFTDNQICNNLIDVINFKKVNDNKVILLLGNHDMQYMYHPRYRCSGYRESMVFILHNLLNENKKLFQIAYQKDKYLWTHAGLTNQWLKHFYNGTDYPIFDKKIDTIAEDLNRCQDSIYMDILMEIGIKRGGSNPFGGPLWSDLSELLEDYLDNMHQIVGHNPQEMICSYGDYNSTITFCDCLANKVEYLEEEIGTNFFVKIKN